MKDDFLGLQALTALWANVSPLLNSCRERLAACIVLSYSLWSWWCAAVSQRDSVQK